VLMYFDKSWSGGKACGLVTWMTQYSATARDDYKRCVCDNWGSGEADCPQGPDDKSNQEQGSNEETDPVEPEEPEETDPVEPEVPDETDPVEPVEPDTPDNGGDTTPDVWKTWATLQEIRDTPHYSETSYSRTLYQVDRELDFIELKIVELFKVATDNNLLN